MPEARPASALLCGLKGRCPRCGQGRLFSGRAELRDSCGGCGLSYAFADPGDGPAVFAIFILGGLVLGGALLVEFKFRAPALGARWALGGPHPAPRLRPVAASQGDADRPAVQAQGRTGALWAPLIGAMWQRLRQARLLWPALFGAAVLAMLIGLGVWQLERLQEKEALLARLAARVGVEPQPLATVERQWHANGDVDYLHARAKGRFHHDKERYLYAPGPAVLGWHVYTPLEIAPGRLLWVNRGWVDDPHKRPDQRAPGQLAGETEVRGLIRRTSPPGPFTPSNDAAGNLWYWPDLPHLTNSAFGASPDRDPAFPPRGRCRIPRPPAAFPVAASPGATCPIAIWAML